MKFRLKKLLTSRRRLMLLIIVIIASTLYRTQIYKPSSPEFLELQRQEKALHLPRPWRRDTSDFGCQWVAWEKETQCYRHIDFVYTDVSVRQQIETSLLRGGWLSRQDATIKGDTVNFDKNATVHFGSWDLFIKNTPQQGQLCAIVKQEYNANYKKNGPWALVVDFTGKTENCPSHTAD